ncbi:MAG: tetratricopeptide repeat protein [Actinoplanes sp.]
MRHLFDRVTAAIVLTEMGGGIVVNLVSARFGLLPWTVLAPSAIGVVVATIVVRRGVVLRGQSQTKSGFGEVPRQCVSFVLRRRPIRALRKGLRRAGHPPVVILAGVRGSGKTELAAAHAHRRARQGRVVWWVDASTPERLTIGLRRAAGSAGVVAADMPATEVTRAVRDWLRDTDSRWLLVLDDAADPDAAAALLPGTGRGEVLVTTSVRGFAAIGAVVDVDVFTEAEALDCLRGLTGLADDSGARDLARALGGLPLALAQAGALMRAQRISYATLLARLANAEPETVLTGTPGDRYERGCAEVIGLSLRHAADTEPTNLAGPIVDVLSLLPSPSPRWLLAKLSSGDASVADQALGHLSDHCLVTLSVDEGHVAMHGLIAWVHRERLRRRGALDAAVAWLAGRLRVVADDLTDDDGVYHYLAADMRDPVAAIVDAAADVDIDDAARTDIDALREWHVASLIALNAYADAADTAESLVRDRTALRGAIDPSVVEARAMWGEALMSIGRSELSLQVFRDTVAALTQKHGKQHPATMTATAQLGEALLNSGSMPEGLRTLVTVLRRKERRLGRRHPDTVATRSVLGMWYVHIERPNDAVLLLSENLRHRPDSIDDLGWLAVAHCAAGEPDEAVTLAEQAMTACDDGSRALPIRRLLARTYLWADRVPDAVRVFEAVHADSESHYTPVHPVTIAASIGLAEAYQSAGRYRDARSMLAGALAAASVYYGPIHREVSRVRHLLMEFTAFTGRTYLRASLMLDEMDAVEHRIGSRPEFARIRAEMRQTMRYARPPKWLQVWMLANCGAALSAKFVNGDGYLTIAIMVSWALNVAWWARPFVMPTFRSRGETPAAPSPAMPLHAAPPYTGRRRPW